MSGNTGSLYNKVGLMRFRIRKDMWIVFLLLTVFPALSIAYEGAVPLFSISDDPVVMATAGAMGPMRRGGGSLFSNPAGIADAASMVHLSHGWLYQDISRTNGAVAVRSPVHPELFVGAAISSIGYPSMEQRSGPSTISDGEFGAHETKAGISLAYGFPFGLRIGCMGSIIDSRIGGSGVTGWAMDLGLQQSIPSANIEWGVSALNVGSLEAIDEANSDSHDLWAVYQAGITWATPLTGVRLAGTVRLEHDDEILELLGVEYAHSRYRLRAGKTFGHETRDFAAGCGVEIGSLMVDYAWESNEYDLGSSHRLSMGWLL